MEPRILLAQQVAVMHAAGFKRSEIRERTGATPAQLREAFALVEQAADNLDLGEIPT